MLKPTREYMKLLTESLADKTGVKIREGANWSCNLKTKEIVYKPEDLKDRDYPIIRGLLLHESAHINYTQVDPNEKDRPVVKQYGQVVHEIYNAYEDIRIEEILRQKYGDYARDSLNHCNANSINYQIEKSNGDMTNAPKLHQFLLASLFHHDAMINPLSEQLIGYGATKIIYNGEKLKLDDEVRKRLMDNDRFLSDLYYKIKTTPNTLELMNLIDTELVPIIKDFIIKAPPDQKIPNMSSKEEMGGDRGKGGGNETKEQQKLTEEEARALLTPYINTLAHRLHDILDEQKATRYRGAKKSGKLLSQNAYKVLTGDTRIFSRKTTPDAPDYNIFIGLDSSGSMSSTNRIYYAQLSAVLLNEVAKKLGFKCNIYDYSNRARSITSLNEYGQVGGGTNDTELMKQINQDLTPDKKSLIFIITDGYPNRTNKPDETEQYRVLEEKAIKKGASIYAIGMGQLDQDIFRRNYKNAVIVPDIENLPAEMIGIIRQVIHR